MEKEKTKEKELTLEERDWHEEKVLFEWEAPERSYQKKDRDFWITAISILVLVSVILFFVKEFFLIIALVSVLFLYYVLSTVPPQNVKYKITNRGIYFGEDRYQWDLFSRFWIKKSLSNETINFETILRFPRQISLVINESDKEKIKELVVKRLPLVEESPNFVDKLTKWFVNKLPLENRDPEKKA
ncbi:MAG TPA: hypothetical protein PKZ92_01395 [Candidatus Woesebacteria bacterium]|jgi:hypothetical protein|nr:hypothetical protein [Candidatus Shapirobacteria bacterium]HOR01894.1 hypothetical protein [Candidatus Woesebacteria bacterium]